MILSVVVRAAEVTGFAARKFLNIFVAYLLCSATFPPLDKSKLILKT
jgi:hypothetical protein